jgi:hypothetical protein
MLGNSSVIGGEGIQVIALHNGSEAGPGAGRARAESHSSSGALVIGLAGATATAESSAEVTASVANGTSVVDARFGTLDVIAGANNESYSTADGIALGGVAGIGVSAASATSSGSTIARIEPLGVIRGAGVNVNSATRDIAISQSEAAAGGLLAAGNGAVALSHVEPFILAELQHDVDIEVMGTVEVATESATEGDAVARGISLAGGVSGGASLSSATIAPTIAAQIGNGVSIAAGESIEIFATHNDKVTPYNGSFNGNADVNTAANQIELPGAHGLSTGDRVTYVDGGGATIGGLVDGQSYAVIVVDDNTVRLGQVFDATTQVSSVTDAITFNIAHGFTNGQRVIYGNNGNTSISGLNAGSAYFVHVVNDFTIKLYSSLAEATAPDETFTIVDVNGPSDTIDLTGNPFTEGEAVTYFGPESLPFAGAAVNAQGLPDNSITFQDFGVGDGDMGGGGHGFANGEHISYRADDAEVVGGLVDGGDYYVVVIDVNTIQLASDPELSNIIALTSPDDPDDADDEPSLHYLSRYQEVPLGNLQDGRTYYVHLVDPMSDPNIIQLRETPGGSAVNLITANTTGTHRLRQAGVQLNPAGTSGVHTLAADLTALGNGVQRLIGAGGALGVASASVNGVSAANAVGSGGALFGSFRLSQGEVHVDADVSASTGTNVTLEAAEDVRVETRSSINSAGVGRVFSGAFVGIGTARADVQISHDAASSIGAGSEVRAGRNIVISTETNHDATGNTRAVGGGGIAAATADTNVDILHSTLVDIGNGAELHADGNVDLFSEAEFGGNLIAEASSGGLAIRPDTETRYAVGDSDTDLEDTVIRIGANAVVAAEDTTTMTAQVDNDGRIDLRSESNAYGVVADTNADANIAIRSRAQIEVESGATILGREAILATAQHEPLNVYTSAIADGKALSDSDAHVRFSPLTESYVIGADNATWISHDLTVRAEVHENQFGYSWRYFGAWPVSDGGATLTWRSDREIIFDSDVVLLSRDAELIVDAFGVVTSARGVTVNGGQGEGYLVPGASFSVDPIVNNTPGHALFETNILESEPGVLFANRGGAVRGSTPGVTRGVVYVRHTIDQIDIQNHTGKHMTINGIAPIDRDGNPAANVDIHSREISLEFDIAHRFEETDIHIETTSTGDADIRLDGVIDNPIGTTSIVNHAGDITRVPEGVVSDQLIRTNVLSMNAPGSVGAFGNSVTDLRIHIDLVQSLGRPEDLQVVAGEDIVLDLRGVRRQSSLSPFQVDISNLTAGGTVDVFVRKAIEESVLIGVPAYDLFVDTDVYTSNPPGDFFERHYTPDQPGGAIIQGGVVGVFGGNAVEIPATYHFDYVEGQQVHIFSVAQDDCIDINATIVLVDDGPGVIDLLGPGDITLNVPSGDAPIGQIQSLLGNVSVTAVGSIVNGGSSTLPNVIGVRVTLASQQGEVGRTRFPLRVDSAPSIAGGLNVEAELGIHVAETAGLLRLGSVITRSGSVVITSAGGLLGDFNQDGVLTTLDVDALVRQLSGTRPILSYDTTGDAIVDFDDLADWVRNLKKTEFGDVNLDFVVDGEDLNVITRNLFARDTVWSSGNLDGHSGTDVRDFNLWNTHKFQQVQSRIQPAKAPPRAALATAESAGHDQHFAALHSAAEALGSDSTKLARWRQQSQRRRQAGEFAGEYLQSVDSLFAGW